MLTGRSSRLPKRRLGRRRPPPEILAAEVPAELVRRRNHRAAGKGTGDGKQGTAMMSARYNPPQRMSFRPRLYIAAAVLLLTAISVRAASFDGPAADLARQIAALAGPGPARLVILNNSSLPTGEIPVIRRSLERDLRGLGVLAGGAESATLIRVTLSQNMNGGLWVAEVREGTELRVAMVPVSLDVPMTGPAGAALTLRRTLLLSEPEQILDAAVFASGGEQRLVVLEPERFLVFTRNPAAITAPGASPTWNQPQSFPIERTRSYPRDLRGRIVAAQNHLFDAFLRGVQCTGTNAGAQLSVSCAESDDPWQVTSTQRAFYNTMRDNFTGVLAPGFGMRLPPFYSAAELPRIGQPATLLNSVSGKVL